MPGDPDLPDHVVSSVKNPCWWFRVYLVKGTSSEDFFSFVLEDIVESFPENIEGRAFMWDNLNYHLGKNLYNQLIAHGHFPIFWPQWNPRYIPTKWVFNQLGCHLRLLAHEIDSIEDLMEVIKFILTNISGFDATFAKCGY